ncbi:phage tail assembly chaperone [Sphingobium yanoikuyae]|nr:hypothetical protein BRX37_14155 [Sphingomonas sp. S-NIH.Pt3_0716]
MGEDLLSSNEKRVQRAQRWFLENHKEVPQYADFYWQAFRRLHTERPMVMGGLGAIPITKILEYARHYGLTDNEAAALSTIVMSLDGHERTALADRATRAKVK